ncbi:unnamed protein product [Urochloa humidicola]
MVPLCLHPPRPLLAAATPSSLPCPLPTTATPCRAAPPPLGRKPAPPLPKRNSSCLADKEPATFVDATSKAMQRKAIRESLAACSADLKRQVQTRKLLKKKNPIGALDLGRLAKAVGLSCAWCRAVAVAAATDRSP